jgi:hypothetical protein
MKPHITESLVIDASRRRRYRPRTLYHATPATDSTKVDLALVLLTAVAGARILWLVIFAFMLLIAPGPVR